MPLTTSEIERITAQVGNKVEALICRNSDYKKIFGPTCVSLMAGEWDEG